MDTKQNMPGTTGDTTGRTQQSGGQSSGVMGTVTEKARDVASSVADKARDVASSVSDTAGRAKETVQQYVHTAGDSVAHAKDAAVDWASGAASHTGEALKGAGDELTGVIRRYPIPALLVGIGLGMLLAKLTDRSA
jgi:hypothetical protein